jgi:hypothetical protein
MGGSQVLLDVGERQDVGTLLKCMIVGSANDAAVALAEAMYGSEALCAEAPVSGRQVLYAIGQAEIDGDAVKVGPQSFAVIR